MPLRTILARLLMLAGISWTALVPRPPTSGRSFADPMDKGTPTAKNLPTEWSETENIAWKTAIPGLGHSSPLVGRGLIWLTTATDEGRSLTGGGGRGRDGPDRDRSRSLAYRFAAAVNAKNSHASPTGVLEGDRLYVHFGTMGTALVSTADGQADLDEYGTEARPYGRAGQFADRVAKSAHRPLRRMRRAVHRRPGQRYGQDRLAHRSHR